MHALEISSLSKSYAIHPFRRFEALRDVSLAIRKGEVFGFLGPNGAGKTTTLKIINGLLAPTSGSAFIFGTPIADTRVRQQVGFLPEHPSYYTHLSGFELLCFAGGLFGLPPGECLKRTESLLKRVGLAGSKDKRIGQYSKGMVQRLGIAQALINDPALVVLDEPLSGLDPIGRKEIKDIILSLKEAGKTVFFSTHILADVERVCDRVGILHRGKLIKRGTLTELLSHKRRNVAITFDIDPSRIKEFKVKSVPTAEGYQFVTVPRDDRKKVIEMILGKGGTLVSVVPESVSLEDLFVTEIEKDED